MSEKDVILEQWSSTFLGLWHFSIPFLNLAAPFFPGGVCGLDWEVTMAGGGTYKPNKGKRHVGQFHLAAAVAVLAVPALQHP